MPGCAVTHVPDFPRRQSETETLPMQNVRELLAKLISIPSVNTMGLPVSGPEYGEAKLTEFLESWLSAFDLDVRRQSVVPGRDNLLATYRSPSSNRHVLLEVHQDTVPVEGMIIEPFTPKVEDGKMYGRGACDNKGPMAAMLWALRRLAEERPADAPSVTLALTVDEEHTFLGVRKLVEAGIDADVAVVAEPTDLDIVIAHKGVVRWVLETTGRACHSSTPDQGVSAIYRMAPILQGIEKYARQLAVSHEDHLLGFPTMSVGRIDGGICVNVVPDSCRIEIDRRLVPGENPNEVALALEQFLRDQPGVGDFITHKPWLQAPPMGTDLNQGLTEQFGESINRFRGNHQTKTVPFGTDASAISGAGIPSIVFGPGSIGKAHTEDEFVPLDEVEMACDIYYHFCSQFR